MIEEEGLDPSAANLSLLTEEEEQLLIKKMFEFEKVIMRSAEYYEPHLVCSYLEELAAAFHKFYRFRRVLGSAKDIAEARLALVIAVRYLLKNGLQILGVNAPERM